ncbi:DEAD/DEAH box helicase [Bacteroides sp. 224]|uniref:DEAD/DEAH box helicase n=1 Tax=Bacteroides sp. 224 TaxID=2302936 RepID=UPI0013D49B30|nr:DEAD/DEAH box helicase [Bacteroides sp. 224]NDV67009.1 ATP-dependent helicase [Bacteroides sp. 224]
MKEATDKGRMIIVLIQHPTLGALLIPYIGKEQQEDTILLIEQAFHASAEVVAQMSKPEQQIIKIAARYTEKELMKAYPKEKNISQFIKKLSEEEVKRRIRPRIEPQIQQIVELICQFQIPLYQNQTGNKLLYPHNAIQVSPFTTEAYFHFKADAELFSYSLSCKRNGEPVLLTDKKPVITICTNPAIILLNTELHRFHDIGANRILPFTHKNTVSVDASQTSKYLGNVILPIIRFHEISSEGLPIIKEQQECAPVLSIEENVFDGLSLVLEFWYGTEKFRPTNKETKYAYLSDKNGEISLRYFYRDMQKEEQIMKELRNAHLELHGECNLILKQEAPEKDLSTWIFSHRELLNAHFKLTNSTGKIDYSLDEIHVSKEISETQDWFELHITVHIGEFKIPFIRFRKNILEGKKEYLLPDGKMILLPQEWFSQYADLVAFGEVDETNVRVQRSFSGIVQATVLDQNEQNRVSYFPKEEFDTPSMLKATLRNYQKEGFNWMMHLHKHHLGGCLADDMGLGKTLQTLTLLQYIYNTEEKKPATLVVLPTSLLHNWKREIKKFTTLKAFEYNASNLPKNLYLKETFNHYHLVLTSYGMMRNNMDKLKEYLFEYVILDESQNIKNSDSLTFRAVAQLQSNFRLALTGTPIENSLKDLWSQFHFIQPDLLGNESCFNKQYMTPIKSGDKRMEERLRRLISPYILRRSKEEVAPELPSLTEEIIFCEMHEQQQKVYEEEKNSLRNMLLKMKTSNEKNLHFTALNGIMRLRQLACHPHMVFNDFNSPSGKLDEIISTFETLQSVGHKVLIFSSFVKHLDIIAEAFKQKGWSYALLTGTTGNREEEIARFNSKENIRAFLISLKAGGVGLNLTQADYVFIIDPWWNPAAEMQAISRAHRIGQDKHVIAYRFITQDSIEEKIVRLQAEKKELFETFITENNPLKSLNDREWAGLLEG